MTRQQEPSSCPGCGIPVSTHGGRCPSCGTLWLAPPGVTPRAGQPGPGVEARPTRRASLTPVVVGGVFVAALGTGILWWTLGPTPSTAPEEPAVPPPSPSSSAAPVFDEDSALSRARHRARVWNEDAALAGIAIAALDDGKLDDQSALEFSFGVPTGKLGYGPGGALGPKRLKVTVRADTEVLLEQPSEQPARIAPDPLCAMSSAWRACVGSGLVSSRPMALRYAYDSTLQRAVWRATQGDARRVLDGNSCAIVSR